MKTTKLASVLAFGVAGVLALAPATVASASAGGGGYTYTAAGTYCGELKEDTDYSAEDFTATYTELADITYPESADEYVSCTTSGGGTAYVFRITDSDGTIQTIQTIQYYWSLNSEVRNASEFSTALLSGSVPSDVYNATQIALTGITVLTAIESDEPDTDEPDDTDGTTDGETGTTADDGMGSAGEESASPQTGDLGMTAVLAVLGLSVLALGASAAVKRKA